MLTLVHYQCFDFNSVSWLLLGVDDTVGVKTIKKKKNNKNSRVVSQCSTATSCMSSTPR